MREAVDKAVAEGFTHVAFGDLFLEDVRQYREDRLAGTGLTPLFPLWRRRHAELAREMIGGWTGRTDRVSRPARSAARADRIVLRRAASRHPAGGRRSRAANVASFTPA